MQPATAHHEHRRAPLVRGDNPVAHAQLEAQPETLGLRGEDRVGARLEQEAVHALGADDPAPPVRGLEQDEAQSLPVEGARRGEPRDAASDHRDVHAVASHRRSGRRRPGRG